MYLLELLYGRVDDLELFARFVRLLQGLYSRRLQRSHPDLAVDCWVRTATLDRDLARCLQQYAAQGGALRKGAAESLEAFLSGDEGDRALLEERVHPSTYAHPCEWFFGANTTQRAAINPEDEPACGLIEGGCDCCGSLPSPPIGEGARWPRRGAVGSLSERFDSALWNFD